MEKELARGFINQQGVKFEMIPPRGFDVGVLQNGTITQLIHDELMSFFFDEAKEPKFAEPIFVPVVLQHNEIGSGEFISGMATAYVTTQPAYLYYVFVVQIGSVQFKRARKWNMENQEWDGWTDWVKTVLIPS